MHLVVLCLLDSRSNMEFGNVGFWGRGKKTGVLGEKPPGAKSKGENQHQTQPIHGVDARTRTDWWEVSALTTALSSLQ